MPERNNKENVLRVMPPIKSTEINLKKNSGKKMKMAEKIKTIAQEKNYHDQFRKYFT